MSQRLLKILLLSLLGVSTLAEARLQPIKPGVPGKNKGDIIAPMLDEQVAAWCDFNKQIVVTRTNILCAYVGDRGPTASTASAAPLVIKAQPQARTRTHAQTSAPQNLAFSRPLPKDLTPNAYEMTEYGDA